MKTIAQLLQRRRGSGRIALIILAVSTFTTLASSVFFHQWLWNAAERRFALKAADIEMAIKTRMQAHEAALWAGVGLFQSREDVSRTDWKQFTDTLRLDRYLPGLEGFGYAEIITASNLQGHEKSIRAEGFPFYHVKPVGRRDIYTSTVFLEPFSGRNLQAFGYDMWSSLTLREAMTRARDTGEPVVSGVITLIQEASADLKQQGFMMFLPLYEAGAPTSTLVQRQAAIKGYVFSPFRGNDLMQGILGKGDAGIEFEIYETDPSDQARLIYASNEGKFREAELSGLATIVKQTEIGGQNWILTFDANSSFVTPSERALPLAFFGIGMLISMLLYLTARVLGSQHRNAIHLARSMTQKLVAEKEKALRAAETEVDLRKSVEIACRSLREANSELTRFSSIVAHDLRAPLKRIESFVEILKEDLDAYSEAEVMDVMVRLERSSMRMREMLDSLQNYTKYGRSSPSPHPVRLSVLVETLLQSMQDDLGAARVSVDVDSQIEVRADHRMLEKVLANLLDNAVKFRSTEKVHIDIAATQMRNGMVEVSVTDNGIGIAEEYHAKIFEMFARLHDDDEYEGTGIGLAVCKRIVSDHGGDIYVVPSVSNKTRICFTIPSFQYAKQGMDLSVAA